MKNCLWLIKYFFLTGVRLSEKTSLKQSDQTRKMSLCVRHKTISIVFLSWVDQVVMVFECDQNKCTKPLCWRSLYHFSRRLETSSYVSPANPCSIFCTRTNAETLILIRCYDRVSVVRINTRKHLKYSCWRNSNDANHCCILLSILFMHAYFRLLIVINVLVTSSSD